MDHDITELLHEVKQGSDAAYNKLFALVYSQLKELANKQMVKEQIGHTYSQTDLVHELFIDLANKKSIDWKNRVHFFSLASISYS